MTAGSTCSAWRSSASPTGSEAACCAICCSTRITALDALTIGLFGAIGTTAALAAGLPAIPAVFVGAVSAVGGSILRDLLLSVPIALMQVGSLYAVAALAGAVSLVVLVSLGAPAIVGAIACVALTFVVRVLAVLFHWTLPEQRPLRREPRSGGPASSSR